MFTTTITNKHWRAGGAQGFPTPEVDFPSLEFLKYNIRMHILEYYVWFPPPEEPAIDNPVLIYARTCTCQLAVVVMCRGWYTRNSQNVYHHDNQQTLGFIQKVGSTGISHPWGWFPLLYIENSTKVLEYVWFPPPEEPAIDNPVSIHARVLCMMVFVCTCLPVSCVVVMCGGWYTRNSQNVYYHDNPNGCPMIVYERGV